MSEYSSLVVLTKLEFWPKVQWGFSLESFYDAMPRITRSIILSHIRLELKIRGSNFFLLRRRFLENQRWKRLLRAKNLILRMKLLLVVWERFYITISRNFSDWEAWVGLVGTFFISWSGLSTWETKEKSIKIDKEISLTDWYSLLRSTSSLKYENLDVSTWFQNKNSQ